VAGSLEGQSGRACCGSPARARRRVFVGSGLRGPAGRPCRPRCGGCRVLPGRSPEPCTGASPSWPSFRTGRLVLGMPLLLFRKTHRCGSILGGRASARGTFWLFGDGCCHACHPSLHGTIERETCSSHRGCCNCSVSKARSSACFRLTRFF